ncbi:hypothetical protein ACQ4LE_004685 [Meloidogyne hapla]
MVIPESLTQKYGSSTLIYDSRTNRGYEDVVLVFSHLRLLDILSKNKQWAIDGTFSSAPKPFVQCLCIGAFVHGRIVVCVQALLPSKRTIHYEEVLEAIKCAISPNEPKRVISDFEFHPIISTPVQFGLDSSQPPTPSMSLSAIVEVPRWEMPLVRTPQYPIAFWNVNERALKALAKTNNALESSHYHFIKKLNHHPSMSDFLLAILTDVDK